MEPFALVLALVLPLKFGAVPPLSAQEPLAVRGSGASPFAPDTVLGPPGGPRIVLLTASGEGVAALRLAVPLREGRGEAGAGALLRDLALARMRGLARPVGAEVSASRTPWGLAYSVVGASADFEYLAYLLREAVAPPEVNDPAIQEARVRQEGVATEAVETPPRRIAADLRGQVAPGVPPTEGTPGTVATLDAPRLREVWLRSHQPSAMTLVVSAPVVPEVVLAATRGIGAPEGGAAPAPPGAPAPPEPRRTPPAPLRSWYGEARHFGEPLDPRAAVAALLVSDHIQGSGARGYEISVELWELPERSVLVVVGAASARDAQAMQRAVSGAVAAARAATTPPRVADAVARLRGERVMRSRTPAGLVAFVGRALEATGDPLGAVRAAEALNAVTADAVRLLFDEALARPAFTSQVRP